MHRTPELTPEERRHILRRLIPEERLAIRRVRMHVRASARDIEVTGWNGLDQRFSFGRIDRSKHRATAASVKGNARDSI